MPKRKHCESTNQRQIRQWTKQSASERLHATSPREPEEEWGWTPPDLSANGTWYNERVRNLETATAGWENQTEVMADGLRALEIHRKNYTEAGPQYLQLLWWEFPREHREAIRVGSSMNFLVTPSGELEMNSDFEDPEQLETATNFFDELIKLGVLRPATTPLRANCPLFLVAKPGQAGQWRCIADCKRGGQNACSGKDPVYLSRAADILPRLYSGGWSAVADASKHFHNFPTRTDEQQYLGCIHPKTGLRYHYGSLPMGCSNAPAIACRIGNSVLRLLRRESGEYQGTPVENSWRQSLADGTYLPGKGHGRIIMGEDGEPAALIWGHVDDYFVHAATREKCTRAFNSFMDLTVRLGFICQKVKTSPPAQVQKFCGFLYDTTGTPRLVIPEDKVTRARATIDFLRAQPNQERLGRLTLAVALGRLESLVEATPQRIGHTYLRRLYDELHTIPPMPSRLPRWHMYATTVILSDEAWEDLNWWHAFVKDNPGCSSRTGTASSLAATWGDGSGTGTGGSFEKAGEGPLDVWMGTWAPHVQHQSSNWRELRTLLRTLERERERGRVQDTTLFYFTDNLVTYFIVQGGSSTSPELHRLIRRIQILAIELGCRLEVIHVPGTLMIAQGADGLSRGLWMSPERVRQSSLTESSQALFQVPFRPALGEWALMHLGLAPWALYSWQSTLSPWSFESIFGKLSIWTPTPETARQALTSFLDIWVEGACDTSAIFLIPRILQREWGNISQHVLDKGTFYPSALPAHLAYDSLIPFVLLYVPPYVRTIPDPNRMDANSSGSQYPAWLRKQVEVLRGL